MDDRRRARLVQGVLACDRGNASWNLIIQGVEPNVQPPRIQVALATGKLVLLEQGCLGQGGCEAKPDYEGVEPNATTE